ncbi:MAG TPA: hypothetical protein DEF51_47785, partial [Myxococcales bacterium]|nr:hypothetical protein [Myxococcales bacterium]
MSGRDWTAARSKLQPPNASWSPSDQVEVADAPSKVQPESAPSERVTSCRPPPWAKCPTAIAPGIVASMAPDAASRIRVSHAPLEKTATTSSCAPSR